MDIRDMLVCPKCYKPLDSVLKCGACGAEYAERHGVVVLLSQELSGDQISLWGLTDETLEDREAFLRERESEREMRKDYASRKNAETKAAEKKLDEYTGKLLKGLSGIVCDLATGRGGMLRKVLAAGTDAEIVCTDIDPLVLAWTKADLAPDNGSVHCVAADGRFLPFREESFDYVVSLAGFSNIPETEKVIEGLYRILKKGGELIAQSCCIEKGSKSYELAKKHHMEIGLVEENLLGCLRRAGFERVKSITAASAVWAENPYDLIPAAGDTQKYCVIQAVK